RPATDIGWDILGAPRAPDGSSLFTRNRRQSRLGPRAPIYRQRRQPLFATAADQPIQKRICSRIIGLARRAGEAQDRRKHDEMIKMAVPGELVEQPAACELR